MNKTLEEFRSQIGQIDENILALLERRMAISKKIGQLKVEDGGTIIRPEIEKEKLDQLTARGESLNPHFIQALFYLIFRESSTIQIEEQQNQKPR